MAQMAEHLSDVISEKISSTFHRAAEPWFCQSFLLTTNCMKSPAPHHLRNLASGHSLHAAATSWPTA